MAHPDLTEDDRQTLLRLARETVQAHTRGTPLPFRADRTPGLSQHAGVFVSLHLRPSGHLRGCVGTFVADKPLDETTAAMAIAASAKDPRFPPVETGELDNLTIQLSVLSPPSPIRPDAIRVGEHGLRVSDGHHIGVLLPQVPVERQWDVTQFLERTCEKAGLPAQAWKEPTVCIEGFTADVFGDPEDVH